MPLDASVLLHNLLAQGVSLDALEDALIAHRRGRSGRGPTLPPEASGGSGPTLDLLDGPDPTETEAGETPPLSISAPRYEDLGPLGTGGMGEVRRIRDHTLGRTLARKTLHATVLHRPEWVARFREEAQVTAQLQHPGIIPVHDLGHLPDGRVWFTMKEVTGKTFGEVISEVHAASTRRWRSTPSGWSLRRLVEAVRQVCDAVGFAHSRGVVHRDLKPDNIMVGEHGEVLVLDWGLAKLLRDGGCGEPAPASPLVATDRIAAALHRTRVGRVAGTPAYMPPEQARGDVEAIGPHSDIYALGALLYTVLAGRPPFLGDDPQAVLAEVCAGSPEPLGDSVPRDGAAHRTPPLPPSLVAAITVAMARDPADRFGSAEALAGELQAWLDGDRRRAEAHAVVTQAAAQAARAAALRDEARARAAEARALLESVEPWQPEADKRPGWAREDAATALARQAERAELAEESLLHAALTYDPDLPEAHAALAQRYLTAHAAAEARRDDTTRAELLLRAHTDALPDTHPDRQGLLTYLRGHGALSLVTDPPGAEVLLYRYTLKHRRLVPVFHRVLGVTPLQRERLPMGSYLCVIRHPSRAVVHYPVAIQRGQHWDGVPPEGGGPAVIPLPSPSALGPEDHYVPAGWFPCGGDPHHDRSLPAQRVWVDGHIFRRFPVTNQQYLAFLNELVAAGQLDEAMRYAPRERPGTAGQQGALIYGFNGRRLSLRPDSEGHTWEPSVPVCMVDWHSARAFAAWETERTGQPWQLPCELAWEKAARGVDGRFFPWGDAFDPAWASMRRSRPGRALPTPVGAFPADTSPYGVRDLSGSMLDWCADEFAEMGPPSHSARHGGRSRATPPRRDALRVMRGGAWGLDAQYARATNRGWSDPTSRNNYLGFRLARPFPSF